MGVQWQPLEEIPEAQPQPLHPQPHSMLHVKEVDFPPALGVEVVQPPPQPWWHFVTSCLGTTFCHCFGLAGTMLMCPTSRGKAGAACGFAFTTFKIAVCALVLLAVVHNSSAGDIFKPDVYTTQVACEEARGTWGVPDVLGEHRHHEEEGEEEEEEHHRRHHGRHHGHHHKHHGHHGHHGHHHEEVDAFLFGMALKAEGKVDLTTATTPRCMCPHLYLPKWDDEANAMICVNTERFWKHIAGMFIIATGLIAGVANYYLREARVETQPTVIVVGQPQMV